ncbi:glycosyltransferase family 2 protein [Pedobacter aquatilis]|uniref:glycosyltransferase family 2 protein n=1 Tax=Pedobacter aquatilis TaxID=351343 RepID=UPI0025B4163A|nr:glycosyltransferase family 2 protein [Pedobacter aquatilis]MDN3587420.1 glycosyltransferase family 2 protein [Pedobacter aquatilis]
MATKQPLVSIALCTYNGEKYIAKQLDSILNQDYPNLEIIISDDVSSDGTAAILEYYAAKNQNIKFWINDFNLGFNQNFKKAIDNCSGDFIAIADQDDIWLENKISVLVNNIGDNLLIYHNSEFIDNQDKSTRKSTLSHHRFVKGECAKNLLYYNCVSGHTCLIKKELLTLTPEFPAHFYYDWWLAYTAACTGRITYLTDKLVLHRKHEESSTGKDKTDAKTTRKAHLNLFLNHPLTPKNLKEFIQSLLNGYELLNTDSFSTKLFNTLVSNVKSLFYIRKRSVFSLIKLIYRESSK